MKYHLVLTSSDPIGLSLVYEIVVAANLGAVVKEGTIPSLKFPFTVSMELESDVEPEANPHRRVFREDNSEVAIVVAPAAPVASAFSTESTDAKVYSREDLDAMQWPEVQSIAKVIGVTGRDREKVTKAYLAKVAG